MVHRLLAGGGNIGNVIGGVAPSWGPFGTLGAEARTMIDVVMAAGIAICMTIAAWGASKQRFGSTARNSMHAEEGKGLIVAGMTGTFLIGSLATIFTIIYGMSL